MPQGAAANGTQSPVSVPAVLMSRSDSGSRSPDRSSEEDVARQIRDLVATVARCEDVHMVISAAGDLRYLTRDLATGHLAVAEGLVGACLQLLYKSIEQYADSKGVVCAEQAAAILQNLTGPADDRPGGGYDHFAENWEVARQQLLEPTTAALDSFGREGMCTEEDASTTTKPSQGHRKCKEHKGNCLPAAMLKAMSWSLLNGTPELKQHIAALINNSISTRIGDDQHRRCLKIPVVDAGLIGGLCECLRDGAVNMFPAVEAAGCLATLIYGVDSRVPRQAIKQGALELAGGMLKHPSSWLSFEKGIRHMLLQLLWFRTLTLDSARWYHLITFADAASQPFSIRITVMVLLRAVLCDLRRCALLTCCAGAWLIKGMIYCQKPEDPENRDFYVAAVRQIISIGVLVDLKRCLSESPDVHSVCQSADMLVRSNCTSGLWVESLCVLKVHMTDDRVDNNDEPLIAIVAAGLIPVMLSHLQDSLGQIPVF